MGVKDNGVLLKRGLILYIFVGLLLTELEIVPQCSSKSLSYQLLSHFSRVRLCVTP